MSEYDLRAEAQRIIDAIHPQAGATMTLMCALHEAWQAGVERRQPVWRFFDAPETLVPMLQAQREDQ